MKKICLKQVESPSKGDWIDLVQTDFAYIKVDFSAGLTKIQSESKVQYNKYIKEQVSKAAFKEYLYLKQNCKKKLKHVNYTEHAMQLYLISKKVIMIEKNYFIH